MKKYFRICFQDRTKDAVKEIKYLREAFKENQLHIYSKYDIRLQQPEIVDNYVVVEIAIPDNKVNTFVVGRQLRIISDYLMRKHSDRYAGSKKQIRLIKYIEIPKPNEKVGELQISDTEKLTIISRVLELVNDPSDKAQKTIKSIIDILNV